MAFTLPFVITKTILVLISIVLLLVNPKLVVPLLILNVGVAVAESLHNRHILNALLGAVLMIWIFNMKYDDVSPQVPAMIILYTLWNIQFHYIHVGDIVTSLSHTLIPLVVALRVYTVAPEYTLRVFALARFIALSTHGIHYASPVACHSQGVY
jgi:hypothetical protein